MVLTDHRVFLIQPLAPSSRFQQTFTDQPSHQQRGAVHSNRLVDIAAMRVHGLGLRWRRAAISFADNPSAISRVISSCRRVSVIRRSSRECLAAGEDFRTLDERRITPFMLRQSSARIAETEKRLSGRVVKIIRASQAVRSLHQKHSVGSSVEPFAGPY